MRFIEWMDYKVCQILLQTGILLTELRYLIRGCLADAFHHYIDLLSVQITKLEEAGYIKVSRSGEGRGSHTVCRITSAGAKALRAYQLALMSYFS